jgi:regulator of sigma D
MKRILYILCCCVSLLFLSCSKTAVVNDTISAYEEATKKVEAASNQDEYNSINDQLLAKLYTITQEYPDYQDVLTKAVADDEINERLSKAVSSYRDALSKKAGMSYMFMTIANFENAEKMGGKSSDSDD